MLKSGRYQRVNAELHRTCEDCKRIIPIESPEDPPEALKLYTVRIEWRHAGKGGKTFRMRTIKHQCSECAEKDPLFNSPAYKSTPYSKGLNKKVNREGT